MDLRKWLVDTGAKTIYRTRLSVGEPLLRKLQLQARDEFLNPEIFYSIKQLRVMAERWPRSLQHRQTKLLAGHKPPAPGRSCYSLA
jgi:putative transposase